MCLRNLSWDYNSGGIIVNDSVLAYVGADFSGENKREITFSIHIFLLAL